MSDHSDQHTIVLLGNPNTGKSSLFSALTGTRQKIANFPGVTVEAKVGNYKQDDATIEVIDLPGTYSLAAKSPDERVAIDALLGRTKALSKPDGLVVVLDASSLDRNLYLATQVLEFGLPTVVVLTMMDVAEIRGIKVDTEKLSDLLGVPVVLVNSPAGKGLDDLKATLHKTLHRPGKALKLAYPEQLEKGVNDLFEHLCDLSVKAGNKPAWPDALRLLIDGTGPYFEQCEEIGGQEFIDKFNAVSESAADGKSLAMLEAQTRYGQISKWTREAKQAPKTREKTLTDKIDSILTHKVWGSLVFVIVMGLIFQSIYEWSGPMMEAIEGVFGALGGWVGDGMDNGMLKSLIVDGVIGGVGGVLVFLPQILILFLFIAILEDLGYMSRAAFLMDRIMSRFGLTGRSFIPLLSSFACAIPGVMGARVIEDRNTRLTTIFLAPFMSCSARLPVYVIFIAAFVPNEKVLGFLSLQALTLFAMYWVGVLAAIPTAIVLKR
ncbi:MAG: ferrous iron transport protein B, partial [Planctomycetota bacterium]